MEVSTSYCTTTANYKYGSYNETDELHDELMDDEEPRFGSYGSRHDPYVYEDSIGDDDEEEGSSCDENEAKVAVPSNFYDYDYEESMPSDDEAVEEDIDYDDEEDDDDEWTNQKNAFQGKTIADYAAMEMLRIRFPFQSISIRISDFCCLQEKDLLNDTMIDFYLNHIVEHILPDNLGRKVTVLPSVFWHNLSLRKQILDNTEEEKTMTEEQKLDFKFKDLHEFVEDFDLHDVDYIVVPVNEWEHWSLAVICHPFTEKARTILFDSQVSADLNDKQNMSELLDTFLRYSWKKRTGTPFPFPLKTILPAELPQQANNFDCGVFIVEFARRFLLEPPRKFDDGFDFSKTYPDFSIERKRLEMQKATARRLSQRHQHRRSPSRLMIFSLQTNATSPPSESFP
ncbi:unnamed protein product [Caenorhabditis auriculariae]|uniref:Ubiquitin-like protease family profile domain-containing protein n=1 Tax=Caenorhabditis auriculariae TaxID=2777116 RepID=A0A8S1HB91_9PELO|nr:unnamed protein product [Caenorhabditis auriculariae]